MHVPAYYKEIATRRFGNGARKDADKSLKE